MDEKQRLREQMRTLRREHVAALPESILALMFSRPPSAVVALMPEQATVGLYHALNAEAPTLAYAKWFHENGHAVALPWFEDRNSPMRYRLWNDPYDEHALELGPFRIRQPNRRADEVIPEVAFVPLIAFTAQGQRLGQGGGHYDRWLARHPQVRSLGLAWDCQQVEFLPLEPHDQRLHAIVTPTRLFEGEH